MSERFNGSICCECGQRIERWDDPSIQRMRYQHGPNPEHSLMLNESELPGIPAGGSLAKWVHGWLALLHDYESANAPHAVGQGGAADEQH